MKIVGNKICPVCLELNDEERTVCRECGNELTIFDIISEGKTRLPNKSPYLKEYIFRSEGD